MASLKINTGTIEASNRLDSVRREDWGLLVGARRSFVKVHIPYDCRELLRFREEAEEMYGPLGYKSVDEFIEKALEIDPQIVDWAIEGLKSIKPGDPVPFEKAIRLGKHGGDRKSEKVKNQGSNITLKRGTSSEYRLAVLERDHPDVAADLEAGKHTSVAAAWRAAGLEKPKDPVKEALRWWNKMDAAQRRQFKQEIE